MFSKIWSWIKGVSSSVWSVFGPILKSELAKWIAEEQKVIADAVTEAAANPELKTGSQKFEFVKQKVAEDLKRQGKVYRESWLELGINIIYRGLQESGKVPPSGPPTGGNIIT